MADTTTLAKAFIKPEIGSHPDTWGDVLNGDIDMIDSCVGGVAAFTVGGNFTISAAQAQNLTYEISGALSADATITFPVYRGFAFVRNLTTGGHQLVCRMNTGGASIAVGPGIDRLIVGDGVDFFSNVLSVPLSGGTMTGPLVINTAAGTTGLNVSANVAIGGVVGVGGNIDAPTFSSHGIAALTGASLNTAYTSVYDNSGAQDLILGGTNDPTNYYRQTNHQIQGRSGTGTFASFNAGGVALYGTTSIINSGANGSLTINGTGTALNVPNGSTNLSSLNVVNGATAGSLNVTNTSALHAITGTSLNLTGNAAVGNYIFFSGGGGAVNTTGGPLIYADTSNTVIKIGSGGGSILIQNFAGTNVASINAAGAFGGSAVSVANVSATGAISATGNISSSAQLSGSTVVTNGLTVNGSSQINNGNSGCTGQVQGNQVYGSGTGQSVYANDQIYANGLIESVYNGVNAIYAPNGGIYTGSNLYCSSSGVIYNNIGNHGFNFRWDGANIFARVDNSYEIPIANANSLGAYLPLTGGTITSALNVNGRLQVFNSMAVNNGLSVNSGGMGVNGDSTFNNALTVQGNFQGASDVCSGGVFRRHILGTGAHGAFIECWSGSDWDSMGFALAGGGYLFASPDDGVSGFNYTPNSGFSDARLKADIRDTEVDALAAICAIPVRAFEWTEEGRELIPLSYYRGPVACGIVAQDLEETMPFAVTMMPPMPSAEELRRILYEQLDAYYIRAIQQLTKRVEELEAA